MADRIDKFVERERKTIEPYKGRDLKEFKDIPRYEKRMPSRKKSGGGRSSLRRA